MKIVQAVHEILWYEYLTGRMNRTTGQPKKAVGWPRLCLRYLSWDYRPLLDEIIE